MATQKKPTNQTIPDIAALKRSPDLIELTTKAATFNNEVALTFIDIDSDEEYAYIAERSKAGTGLARAIRSYWTTSRELAYKTWKSICADVDGMANPIEDRIKIIDRSLIAYQRKKEVERQQRIADAQKKADEEHDAMFLDAAETLQNEGRHEEADQVLNSGANNRPAVSIPAEAELPEVKGLSTRKTWDFEILNADLLPRAFMMPDESKIAKVVKAMGPDTNIPKEAIRIFEKDSLVKRLK